MSSLRETLEKPFDAFGDTSGNLRAFERFAKVQARLLIGSRRYLDVGPITVELRHDRILV
jgi:hypothetical protein